SDDVALAAEYAFALYIDEISMLPSCAHRQVVEFDRPLGVPNAVRSRLRQSNYLSFAGSLDREARKTSSKTRSSVSTLRNSTPTVSWCTHLTVARRTSTGGSSQGRFIMSVSFWPGRNKRLTQSRAPVRETSSKVPSSESSVAHDLTEASPVTAMRLTK